MGIAQDLQERLGQKPMTSPLLRSRTFLFPEDTLVAVNDVTKRVKDPVRPLNIKYEHPTIRERGLFEFYTNPEIERQQAKLDIDPNAGLFPALGKFDLTRGLAQDNPNYDPELPTTTDFIRAKFEGRKSVGEFPVPDEFPNILQRDAQPKNDPSILYGPKAGILAKFATPFGELFQQELPDMDKVRPEGQKSEVGEIIGSVGGEIAKYAYLGYALGGFGFTGGYKWTTAGAASGFGRQLLEKGSVSEALHSPDVYIEASLAGSPFILKSAWQQGARFLKNYVKRPINEIPGETFYRNGKIIRPGETPANLGKLVDASGRELTPLEVLIPDSPAMKLFNDIKAGMPKMKDEFAQFVDNSAAAAGFMASLADDLSAGIKVGKNAKGNMFGATKFLWQSRNLGKTLEFKSMMGSIQKVMEKEHIYSGSYLERLRELGITEWNGSKTLPGTNLKNNGEALATLLERGDPRVAGFRELLDDAHGFAQGKGIDVSGYRKDYFPRMLKHDVAKDMVDDMQKLLSGSEGDTGLEAFGLYLAPDEVKRLSEIAKVWSNAGANKERSLAKALNAIVKDPKNGIDNYGDALFYLRQQTYEDLFSPMGNLERPRILDLPDGFYERDARNVLVRYIRGVAKRSAIVEEFDKNGAKASDLLKSMALKDKNEADIAKQILDSYTGKINITKSFKGQFGSKLQTLINRSMDFEVATKIGFGTATIPNITQILISALPEAGVWRTIRGGLDLLKAENRKRLRKTGILLDSAQDAILGFTHDDGWRRFVDITLEASGFAGINRINQYWSGAIGRRYIRDLYRISQREVDQIRPEGLVETVVTATIPRLDIGRIEWARRKLSQMGIDYRNPLSSEVEARGMWRFANESQLQRNVLREPLLANDPRFRWMFLFKKFGLKQAQLTKERVLGELAKEGNVFPMLRLGAAGYLGGEFVKFSKDRLSSIVSGQPYYREPEANMWERMAENLASTGGFGVFGDLGATLLDHSLFDPEFQKEDMTDIGRNLKFYGLPVQAQTVADVYTFFFEGAGAEYLANIDDPVAFQEAVADMMKLFGTVSRRLSKRFETEGQSQRRQVSRRSRILSELRDTARMAETSDNPEKGQSLWKLLYERADAWNTANPELYINVDSLFTQKEIDKLLEREKKKKEDREFPKPLNF